MAQTAHGSEEFPMKHKGAGLPSGLQLGSSWQMSGEPISESDDGDEGL